MGQKLSAAADALLKESWQQEDEAEEQSTKGKQAPACQLVSHEGTSAVVRSRAR
jgi:hypothetical protein